MKKLILTSLLLVLAVGSAAARITLPQAEEVKLSNGLTIQIVERHTLPLFSLQMTFRAGSINDPVGAEGLAELSSEMLMRGTPTRTAGEIADEIAFGGGTLSNYCARVSAGFSGEFLAAQGENAFEILADLILNSTVADDELSKTKTRILGDIQSGKEDASSVAGDGITSAVLGDSRYAHPTSGTEESVASLERAAVVQYLADFYNPDNCILVVCGDVNRESILAWIEKYFGKWQGKAKPSYDETAFPAITGKEVIIYDKKDATQTQIRIGGNGLSLSSPDWPGIDVAQTIFGGSFTSRLMNEIRVNRGLTYSVRFQSDEFVPGGMTYVSTFTRNETVGEVVDIILAEGIRMQTEIVADSEHIGGINYRCGLYPLGFETNDDLAGVFSNLWLNGLDKSYYEDYQERLRAVKPEQTQALAQKYFPKDNYRLVLVGKADEIREQAEKYGPVTVIPLTN